MDRTLLSFILKDLTHKIILITGPRQCGKTTLSKALCTSFDYLNYDSAEDRLMVHQKSWDRKKSLIIFDELHKMNTWKRYLKGIYDTEGIPPAIVVTGSAKLDTYRKVGDSLAGRYFQFRLHPFDLKELVCHSKDSAMQWFERLFYCGGFPEPCLKGDITYYKRWRRTHLDIILRQDLIDLYTGRDIKAIETLILLLKNRVGSSISYANLARDLERDANTIKRWLQLLENLYIIFRVTPHHQNVARALLKEPKFYFYDYAMIEHEGARLENMVAHALLKELHFLEDTTGITCALHYLRTKEGKEIDFAVTLDHQVTHLIEVKTSDREPISAFTHFKKFLPHAHTIQLVKTLAREQTYTNDVAVRALIPWLATFHLAQ